MTNKIDNTRIINWLEKEMNKDGLFFFKLVDDENIGAYFKSTGERFCVFYVEVVQRIIDEKEFESEGG